MEFRFHTTPVTEEERETLCSQLAAALSKRMELHSRRTMPGLWSATDRLNSMPKAPAAVAHRRRVRYRIYGVLFLAMGLFLLVPGLMEPRELAVPLVVGALCTGSGIAYLRPPRRGPSRRERRQAERWLTALGRSGGAEVTVDKAGAAVQTGEEVQRIPYREMNALVETDDLFLLSFSRRSALVLKKRDMTQGDPAAFLRALAERTALPAADMTTNDKTPSHGEIQETTL